MGASGIWVAAKEVFRFDAGKTKHLGKLIQRQRLRPIAF
jgi:hypothetical protein